MENMGEQVYNLGESNDSLRVHKSTEHKDMFFKNDKSSYTHIQKYIKNLIQINKNTA